MRTKDALVNLFESILILMLLTIMTDLNAQKATYRMTTDIPASVIMPDSVQTSLGMLRFFDGFPEKLN